MMEKLWKLSALVLSIMMFVLWNGNVSNATGYFYTNGTLQYEEKLDGTLEVTGCSTASESTTSITIPATVTNGGVTKKVTSIGENAFSEWLGLTSVTIPEGITRIESCAFDTCSLTEITIPKSVSYIGDSAFYYNDCKAVVLHNGIREIGKKAFEMYDRKIEVSYYGSEKVLTEIKDSFSATSLYTLVETPKEITNKVTAISLDQQELTLGFKGTAQLIATITPNSGVDFSQVSWHSSNPSYVTVDDSGLVTAVVDYKDDQVATITATAVGGVDVVATCTVRVTQAANVSVTGVSLDKDTAALKVGESLQLNATVLPDNATNKNVTWSLSPSDSQVATVSSTGLVTAVKAGTVTIDVKSDENDIYYARCTITVTESETAEVKVTGISLSSAKESLHVGDKVNLNATISPANATNKTVAWESNNTSVATVDTLTGEITAVGLGTATITAKSTDGTNITASCAVTVDPIKVSSIVLSSNVDSVLIGGTVELNATVYPENATNKTVTWESSNTSFATVNANGIVTAVGVGNVTITARSTDGSNTFGSYTITVKPIVVNSIQINNAPQELVVGETCKLSATIYPSNATNQSVGWESSNSSIAKVDSDGVVTALSEGSVTITLSAKDGSDVTTSCTIWVKKVPVSSITLDKTSFALNAGETFTINATVLPVNATNASVCWYSSNQIVATVSQTGVVEAISSGEATITVKAQDGSNVEASCKVTVQGGEVVEVIPVTSLGLNPNSMTLRLNEEKILEVTILPLNATKQNVDWESTNPDVATVTDGVVKAYKEGTTIITAKTVDGTNISASCMVTVESVKVSEIVLSSSEQSVQVGDTFKLVAMIRPEDADNKEVKWSSTNETVATVDQYGLVTAIAEGEANIKVKTEDGTNLTAVCKVLVTEQKEIKVTAIELSETSKNVTVGDVFTLTAKVNPDNSTDKTIGWKSSDTSVATVDNNGMVTALSEGTVEITAEAKDGSGVKGTCSVNVAKKDTTDVETSDPVITPEPTVSVEPIGTVIVHQSCQVEVTSSDAANPTVAFVKPANKKAQKVTVPDYIVKDGVQYKVTSVANNAFAKNKKVKNVTLGKNIETIGKNAFKNCTALKTVDIKSTELKLIGANAFSGCKKLTTIKIKSTKLTAESVKANAFKGTNKKLTIKVPKSKVKAYKKFMKKKGNKKVIVKK